VLGGRALALLALGLDPDGLELVEDVADGVLLALQVAVDHDDAVLLVLLGLLVGEDLDLRAARVAGDPRDGRAFCINRLTWPDELGDEGVVDHDAQRLLLVVVLLVLVVGVHHVEDLERGLLHARLAALDDLA